MISHLKYTIERAERASGEVKYFADLAEKRLGQFPLGFHRFWLLTLFTPEKEKNKVKSEKTDEFTITTIYLSVHAAFHMNSYVSSVITDVSSVLTKVSSVFTNVSSVFINVSSVFTNVSSGFF